MGAGLEATVDCLAQCFAEKAVQSGFWTGLSPGTEVPRPWDSDKEPCSMQDCGAEGKACCGSTPPCSSSNATCLGRSYAAQAKATNTSTLVYMAAAKKQNAPFPSEWLSAQGM